MKTLVLRLLTFVAVIAGGGLCLGLPSHDAEAFPSPALAVPVATPSPSANAQYYVRRPWLRRQGPIVVPKEAIEADPNLAEGGLNPPVIAIVPVRPTSCGQYRFWNGERCVDARYNDPYLGPR